LAENQSSNAGTSFSFEFIAAIVWMKPRNLQYGQLQPWSSGKG
jgi:hypothetical protein